MDKVKALLVEIIGRIYEAIKFSIGQSFSSARQEYRNELALTMLEYVDSTRPITAFRNQFKRATNDAFEIVFIAGWADGGGSGPITTEMRTWLNAQIGAQMSFIDGVFDELKALRKEDDQAKISAFVGARADGYAGALTGIYSYAKMQAAKKELGVWKVGPTEHCTTCLTLNNQVRTLRWFLENGYIPQQAGSQTLECGGWRCQCGIYDPVSGRRLVP